MIEQELLQILTPYFEAQTLEVRVKQIKLSPASQARPTKDLSHSLKSEIISKLVLNGKSPDALFTSVSHTCTDQGSWIIVVGSTRKIGVDLEHQSRTVHPKVLPRLITPQEAQFDLGVLEYWTAKEAAFKANLNNAGTFVSQYRVTEWNRNTETGRIRFPLPSTQECTFKLIRIDHWLVAVAWLSSEENS